VITYIDTSTLLELIIDDNGSEHASTTCSVSHRGAATLCGR
jgi:hypothetical protein